MTEHSSVAYEPPTIETRSRIEAPLVAFGSGSEVP
jgi:hypothetical protein